MYCLQLYFQRQGRGEALEIILGRMGTLRFQEKLMGVLIGKGAELILDTGTVAGTAALDHPRKERGTVEAGSENLVNLLVGVKKITVHLLAGLLDGRRDVEVRKAFWLRVSGLTKEFGGVDGTDIDARGSSGFHPGRRNSERSELVGNSVRSFLTDPASFERMLADVHLSVQEGSGGQNNRPRMENCPCNCTDARNYAILKEKIGRKICVNI